MGCRPKCNNASAQIIEGAKQKAVANTQPQPETPHQAAITPPAPKVPNLMDHTIALRQEVAALRQELHAVAQVTDAVGQAVGQLVCHISKPDRPFRSRRRLPRGARGPSTGADERGLLMPKGPCQSRGFTRRTTKFRKFKAERNPKAKRELQSVKYSFSLHLLRLYPM